MKKEKNIVYSIVRFVLKIVLFIFMNPKASGLENIPDSGGYILAGNHQSNWDPLVAGYRVKDNLHFLAKKELCDIFLLKYILKGMGIIRVDRSLKENPKAKSDALRVLEEGKTICIFPEGTRNKTSELLKEFKFGAVSFAQKSGKPIVPFVIKPKPRIFGYKTKVIYLKPIFVDKNDSLEEANKKLFNSIKKALLNDKN